jgi:hypothetical protein
VLQNAALNKFVCETLYSEVFQESLDCFSKYLGQLGIPEMLKVIEQKPPASSKFDSDNDF